MELFILPDGQVRALYDETLSLDELGTSVMARASSVEPAPMGGWMVDLALVAGPMLGPFPLRSEALRAEQQWLVEHRLGAPEPQHTDSHEKRSTIGWNESSSSWA